MRRLAILGTMLAACAAAETLDRIAVTVGKDVITESALALDLRVSAFLDRRDPDFSGKAKRESAQRLVDQILILREARDSHLGLPVEAEGRVLLEQVRAQYASADEFDAELERHDIAERDLLAHLTAGLQTLTFTDLRFRPGIVISEEEARAYYTKLASEVQGKPAPFEESRAQIEDLLTGQRVLDALDMWLDAARQAADVRYREKVFQ